MTRVQEIKKYGYTMRLYRRNGEKIDYPGVRLYLIDGKTMTLFSIDDRKIIADINMSDIARYETITKNL